MGCGGFAKSARMDSFEIQVNGGCDVEVEVIFEDEQGDESASAGKGQARKNRDGVDEAFIEHA